MMRTRCSHAETSLTGLELSEVPPMTRPVNYDLIAPAYDRRYETNRFEGIAAVLDTFLSSHGCEAVAEVGCGTGHWLAAAGRLAPKVVGLDASREMLERARAALP